MTGKGAKAGLSKGDSMNNRTALLASLLLLSAAPMTWARPLPTTRRVQVTDTYFRTNIVDNSRRLEDVERR